MKNGKRVSGLKLPLLLPLLLLLATGDSSSSSSSSAANKLGIWSTDSREPIRDEGLDLKSGEVCQIAANPAGDEGLFRVYQRPRQLPSDYESRYLAICVGFEQEYADKGTCVTPGILDKVEKGFKIMEDLQLANCPACIYNMKQATCRTLSFEQSRGCRVAEVEPANEKGHEKIKKMRVALTHADVKTMWYACKDVKQAGGVSVASLACPAFGVDCGEHSDPEQVTTQFGKSSFFPFELEPVFVDNYNTTAESGDDARMGPLRAIRVKLAPCQDDGPYKCDCDNCKAACGADGGGGGGDMLKG